jgi:hypothetical protein
MQINRKYKPNEKRLTILIDPDVRAAFKEAAHLKGYTMSGIAELLFKNFIRTVSESEHEE